MMSESEQTAFGSGVHVYNCDGGLTVAAMKAIDDSSASATGVGNLINGVVLQWLTTLGVVRIVVQVSCSKQEISSLIPTSKWSFEDLGTLEFKQGTWINTKKNCINTSTVVYQKRKKWNLGTKLDSRSWILLYPTTA